ncbi:hypothetical protein TcWFU_009493 [Taenia crassiceps]|uniref:Uncharacterized protein n=1 Tax=Taenia crassiceps TaxID=6207 RepID=A0ABR4QTL8_9CEST
MICIDGCHMFMVNRCGVVGAFTRHHRLTIVVPDWPSEDSRNCAYLRVSQWLYPLDRSHSFIYCWKRDRIIILEPFSHILHPRYIVIRLPFSITEEQAATLWNLLDSNAQVRGKFSHMPNNAEADVGDAKLSAIDECKLSNAPPNANAKDLKVLKPQKFYQRDYSSSPIRLSAALRGASIPRTSREKRGVVHFGEGNRKEHKIVSPSNRKPETKKSESEANKGMAKRGTSNNPETMVMKCRKHLRHHVNGPRNWIFVRFIITPAPIVVVNQVLFAVKRIHDELLDKNLQREKRGIPNPFGGQGTRQLNICGPSLPPLLPQNQQLTNLESAAAYFDKKLLQRDFAIVELGSDLEKAKRVSPCKIVNPLTAQPVISGTECCQPPIDILMVLTASVKADHIYPTSVRSPERVLEECDHHYPKAGTSNAKLNSTD